MNMPFPSREQVESIRKNYPPGPRVMLNNMNDPYSPVDPEPVVLCGTWTIPVSSALSGTMGAAFLSFPVKTASANLPSRKLFRSRE